VDYEYEIVDIRFIGTQNFVNLPFKAVSSAANALPANNFLKAGIVWDK
jgi:hypothetical protein